MDDPDNRRRAAHVLVETIVAMAEAGRPLMARVLPAGETPAIWDHYPDGDAVDAVSGCCWFYHCHPPDERRGAEHGHFHLFFPRRAFGLMPPRAAPAPRRPGGLTHVAALAVDDAGVPIRLFTVNRWVTDEWLFPAEAIAARLGGYSLAAAPGDPLVNRWLEAAVRLFADPIHSLLETRDRVLAEAGPGAAEDRRLEVLSTADVDLDAAVATALGAAA